MKICPICQHTIKNDETVVVLLLAKYQQKDEKSYDLSVMSQTISSHLFCIEKPKEEKVAQ